jgi:hypothetical protein
MHWHIKRMHHASRRMMQAACPGSLQSQPMHRAEGGSESACCCCGFLTVYMESSITDLIGRTPLMRLNKVTEGCKAEVRA